jgi:hypothetical protein
MNTKKAEIRHGCDGLYQPKFREAQEGTGRIIEGYAIVFGVESKLIADYYDVYREIIEKGAITEEELKGMDIKMTIWHNRERLLARSNKGVGTLKLSVDEVGVKYEFEAPNTSDGQTALELVKRGELSGSSFTYWTDESRNVTYTKGAEGELIRHVNKISEVLEMTIASDPAYSETNVSAREVEATGFRLKGENKREGESIRMAQLEMDRRRRKLNLMGY